MFHTFRFSDFKMLQYIWFMNKTHTKKHFLYPVLELNANHPKNENFLWVSLDTPGLNVESEFICILKEKPLGLMNSGKHPLCQMAIRETSYFHEWSVIDLFRWDGDWVTVILQIMLRFWDGSTLVLFIFFKGT